MSNENNERFVVKQKDKLEVKPLTKEQKDFIQVLNNITKLL